jgi:CheY-like chemotaxis protein/DNA-binding transcriptional ArsR family regulator
VSVEFTVGLAEDIVAAADRHDWSSVKADLTALCEQIVQALVEHRDDDVTQICDAVERASSTLATRPAPEGAIDSSSTARWELLALSRLLAVAAQYRQPAPSVETALEDSNRRILEALLQRAGGLSGRELAEEVDMRPETIARKLPGLRAAGLVKTQQIGKANVNRITDAARAVLASVQDRPLAENSPVVLAKTTVTTAPQQGHHPTPQRLTVLADVGSGPVKPIADDFLRRAGKQLAGMNDKLAALNKARKGKQIEELTVRFSPKKRSVVGSIKFGAMSRTPAVVMVVDDSLTVRRVTQRQLERNGYEVLLAKDGVDALHQLRDTRPDIMLVDIGMPRMDGFDLTRMVRGAAATRDIPIIVITSHTAEKDRSLAYEVGVNDYVGKPCPESELLVRIRRVLRTAVPA